MKVQWKYDESTMKVWQKYDESTMKLKIGGKYDGIGIYKLKWEEMKVGGRFDIGEKYDKNTDVKGMQA